MKTTAEMIEVMQAFERGEKIERFWVRTTSVPASWKYTEHPSWEWGEFDYRIAPAPALVPDSIDWSHVAPEFRWMARDLSENAFLYTTPPSGLARVWTTRIASYTVNARSFASYKRGTVDWKDSLVERPS